MGDVCVCTMCIVHFTVPSAPCMLSVERILKARIELNWLPSTEPNGEVHYVVHYTSEGGTEQSIDAGSNLTHYNLTGLERNRVYTNIAVQAVNSAGRSERSAIIAPPSELCTRNTTHSMHACTYTAQDIRKFEVCELHVIRLRHSQWTLIFN